MVQRRELEDHHKVHLAKRGAAQDQPLPLESRPNRRTERLHFAAQKAEVPGRRTSIEIVMGDIIVAEAGENVERLVFLQRKHFGLKRVLYSYKS